MPDTQKIKVVSVINMKGGVGKTTLATNIALALSKFHEKKILLIDNDPQFNATQYYVRTEDYLTYVNDQQKCTILDIYRDRPKETHTIVTRKKKKMTAPTPTLDNTTINIYEKDPSKLDLIPSTLNLMELDSPSLGTELRLRNFIKKIKDAYDYIIIDCPPTMSVFTLSAYLASDAYLIPIKPDHLSSIGISLIERAINKYSETYGHTVEQLGIVFTMVKISSSLMKDTMKTLRSTGRACFENFMRDSTRIARAVKFNQAIFDYPETRRAYSGEITGITKELLVKIEK